MSPPANIEPMPVYIAASAASQIVTNDHDSHSELWADEHGIEPSADTVEVSPGALRLVNTFLDNLLFSFLAHAKSTSLATLRTAVADVLKPKLAKGAITTADGELEEYLGGVEEDNSHDGLDSNGEWDLELVWKRTRLRCMVYSSLGDMEEDDEDRYTYLEELDGPSGSPDIAIVSPAVAIFLTSILEYMGEQALMAAGQAAYHRTLARQRKEEKEGAVRSGVTDRIVIEDGDMERVALDRTLGRIWRGWKKRVRTNDSVANVRHSFSRETMRSQNEGRRNSVQHEPHSPQIREDQIEESDELPEAKIPLPAGDNDIKEIEVPGLTYYSDDEDHVEEGQIFTARPKSMMVFTSNKGLPTPNSSQPSTPKFLSTTSRKRSYSLPSPAHSNFSGPLKRQKSSIDGTLSAAEEPSKSASHSRNVSRDSQTKGVKVTAIAASAMAIGSAAVAGIIAVVKGEAPTTTPMVEKQLDLDESSESEVEIMTSSRISIGNPLDLVAHTEPASGKSSRSASVRSRRGSVTSVRIIDVARSPAPRLEDAPPMPVLNRRISSGLSINVPSSPDGFNPRSLGNSVPRAATTTPTIKNPSPLNHEVPQPPGAWVETPGATTPRAFAIPDRSPLRERPSPGAYNKYEMSLEQAQFASGIHNDEPSFVLAHAPPRKSSKEVRESVTPIQTQNIPTFSGVNGNGYPRIQTPTNHNAASPPPLTPLREMVENAVDTSDDDTMGLSSTSSLMGGAPYRSRTTASDRANKARTSPPTSYPRDTEGTPKQETSSKGTRQGRQSGSSSSSVTSYKPRQVRTSEDSAPSPKIGQSMGKSFDDLIRSETTLQYTLTPQSMRNIQVCIALRLCSHSLLTHTQDIPPSPNQARPMRPRTTSNTSTAKAASFRGHENAPPLPSPTMSHMTGRSSASRMNGAPRDARVENESITDFADFIRSTGPTKPRNDFGPSSPNTLAPPGSRGYTSSSLRANSSAPRSIPITSASSIRTTSSAGRARLQARDAVVQADATSDLIDFIRQGPQSEGPRISRTVAPFRTTMDSDQMSAHKHRLSTLAEVRDSVITNVSVAPSMQSSTGTVNSGTALLGNSNSQRMGGAAKAPPPALFSAFPEEEDMMPKRTRRRVKDPYAIDFSDEEDDEDLFNDLPMPVKEKPKRQEESLMDFLNSAPPPPPSTPKPFMLGVETSVSASPKKKEKRNFWGMRRKVAA